MACGSCGHGKNAAPTTYIFTAPNGQTKTFKTEVEAKAAQIHAGGGSIRAA